MPATSGYSGEITDIAVSKCVSFSVNGLFTVRRQVCTTFFGNVIYIIVTEVTSGR